MVYGNFIASGFRRDVIDDIRIVARTDVTAVVARGFEPVRIERELLARAFDLACELEKHVAREASESDMTNELAEQTALINIGRRRAA